MKYFTFLLLIFSLSSTAKTNNVLAEAFDSHKVNGAMLIESLNGDKRFSYNLQNKQFIPASTFKIPNSLIFLEEQLLQPEEVIKWDEVEREYRFWNKDQTLKTAFKYSCVWCYQRYSKKLSHEMYHDYLAKFDYGNYKTGNDITTFWLEGDLRISLQQQVDFLKRFYLNKLSVKATNTALLKSIMLNKETKQYKLYGKTGWKGINGWYVGFIETKDGPWFFATYIEIHESKLLPIRKQITEQVFKTLNIIK